MLKFALCMIVVSVMPIMALATPQAAVPNAITRYIVDARLVGEGRMKHLTWNIYDASLYASKGSYSPTKPMALSLRYLRPIKGEDIARQAIYEMRYQGFNDEEILASWHKQMLHIFPDVTPGTTLTGILTDKNNTIFLKDGVEIGSINDAKFSKKFFDIWLSDKTSATGLRRKLMNKPPSQ